MPVPEHLSAFLLAALLLAAMPGPGLFYVAARALAAGRGEGIASSLGTGLGGLVHVVAGAIGVSALVMASATAFAFLKWAGAIYLIWLGATTFFAAGRAAALDRTLSGERRLGRCRAFRQGILVEALNPKTAAFFLAFLPQFVDPHRSVAIQFVVLGLISVFLNTGADIIVAAAAGRIHRRIGGRANLGERLRQGSGFILMALGAGLLFARRPAG